MNEKTAMRNPVTTPAWTGKTVSVHLPCPVPKKMVRQHSSRHSSTGLAAVRRDKTTGKPYHSNQNEGRVIAEFAPDALEMAALMTTVKSLATVVTGLFSAVTALQTSQPRDRHCYVCGEIGHYAHMPVIDGQ